VLSKISHLTLIFFVISLAQCAYAKTPNQVQIKVCKEKITECAEKKPGEEEKACFRDLTKKKPECKALIESAGEEVARSFLCNEELKSSKCAGKKNVRSCVKNTKKGTMFKNPECYDFFTKKTRFIGPLLGFGLITHPKKTVSYVAQTVKETIEEEKEEVIKDLKANKKNSALNLRVMCGLELKFPGREEFCKAFYSSFGKEGPDQESIKRGLNQVSPVPF